MPGFSKFQQILEADESGRRHYQGFRKIPSQATVAGVWFDLSMSPGNPPPQYYAASPLVAQQMRRSTDGGLNHGPNVGSGFSKFLNRFLIMSNNGTSMPIPYMLCDYLLFYPFVDTGTNDPQIMTNSSTLPRYESGLGVEMMAVSVAPSGGASPTFVVNYTNHLGQTGRTSQPVTLNTSTANGAIMSSHGGVATASGPFIGLQSGDIGVRSIESVTFTSGTDVGLLSLVLVKPLLTSCLLEQTAPSEIVPVAHQYQMPQIFDDAFLSLIMCPQGSIATILYTGEIETVWN